MKGCVNALSRAILISTTVNKLIDTANVVCQCPQSGNPHFYPALLKPAILAAFQGRFCTYFSEYSEK